MYVFSTPSHWLIPPPQAVQMHLSLQSKLAAVPHNPEATDSLVHPYFLIFCSVVSVDEARRVTKVYTVTKEGKTGQ